jgi:hypothetical protein
MGKTAGRGVEVVETFLEELGKPAKFQVTKKEFSFPKNGEVHMMGGGRPPKKTTLEEDLKSFKDPAIGFADLFAGLGRGTAAAATGIAGDLEELYRQYGKGAVANAVRLLVPTREGKTTTFPTIEEMNAMLPPVVPAGAGRSLQMADVGQFFGENNPLAPTAIAAVKPVVKAALPLAKKAGQAAKKAAISDDMAYALENLESKMGLGPKQIMIGPKAKTFRHDAAALAEQMEKEGRNRDEIWQATKTMRAPDNEFRQELSDLAMRYDSNIAKDRQFESEKQRFLQATNRAKSLEELDDAEKYFESQVLKLQNNPIGKAQDFIRHPELFEAYPELENYVFRELEPTNKQFTAPETVYGFYSPGKQSITVSTDAPYKRSTALHELQHAIQEIEGWQGGSSPEEMAARLAERDIAKTREEELLQLIQEMQQTLPPSDNNLILNEGKRLKNIQDFLNQTKQLEGETNPYDAYRKVSGEEEARMVQARRNYPEEKLAERPPFMDYEADPSLHITDFASGGAVMMGAGGTVKKGIELVDTFLNALKEGDKPAKAAKAVQPSKEVAKAAAKAVKDAEQLASAPVVQTVANPERMQYPGIYKRPDVIAAEAAARVAPESPNLQRLFGVTREDLYQMGKGRKGNLPGTLPGLAVNPKGSKVGAQITTPQNTQRLIDVMTEAEKHPALVRGMDPWYVMDPLFQRMSRELGPERAATEYNLMNNLFGMSSPGSEVMTEIPRGSAAYYLHKQGRFPEFEQYAGMPAHLRKEDFPQDILTVPGHAYHSTAQAVPMRKFLEKGELDMSSPKVPMYIQASGVPEVGFQTATPVGDAHWSRAVGLADVRGGSPANWKKSVSNTEMYDLGPWWREQVAAPLGLESVPAQARAWGAFSPQTGVTTPIGAPKLELIADQTAMAADRLGISPEDALIMFINAKARLGKKEGGAVESDVDGFLDHINKA